MRVFISWSGETMKLAAESLREWMRLVLAPVDPWVSSQDILTGTRSMSELAKILASTKVGIICVSPQTQNSPWVNFEAGALSRSLEEGKVIPFLIGLKTADLKLPLSQFQAVDSAKPDEVAAMIKMINQELPSPVPSEVVDKLLSTFWEDLAEKMDTVRKSLNSTPAGTGSSVRPDRELIEESVLLLRAQNSSVSEILERLDKLRTRDIWNVHAEKVTMPGAHSNQAAAVSHLLDIYFPAFNHEIVDSETIVRAFITADATISKKCAESLQTLATSAGITIEITTGLGTETINPNPPF
ncbi:toll/interleukin-1 receptor domain-containing protein [Pseudofrankia sp. BMG5.36]|uniref:toll/interleukin-1 receptor domain-containing protein n=1 Tax=Pseudofrankia sp. BMG5.36 TaxID=1834512 RepID=UPI000AE7F6BF|nr:toll/interleukin-1 receptor domain-containing protein [Pseudofrankia sp. BMG5.36]